MANCDCKSCHLFIGTSETTTKILTITFAFFFQIFCREIPRKRNVFLFAIFLRFSPVTDPPTNRKLFSYCHFGVSEFESCW